jgi:hypothetical protein
MLMANSGNYSIYPHTKVHNSWGSRTEKKLSVPVIKLSKGSGIHPQTSSLKLRTGSSDIPIVRKHSLQRFLQNHRDRVIWMDFEQSIFLNPTVINARDNHSRMSYPVFILNCPISTKFCTNPSVLHVHSSGNPVQIVLQFYGA